MKKQTALEKFGLFVSAFIASSTTRSSTPARPMHSRRKGISKDSSKPILDIDFRRTLRTLRSNI